MSDDVAAPPLVLASASPRRRELLERLGLRFDVDAADVDEAVLPGEAPDEHVRRLALAKARVVAVRHPGSLVVGGDTVVVLGGEILGKPSGPQEAADMLSRLQGREHRVETGVAVVAPGGAEAADVVSVPVRFRSLHRSTIEAYVATGEPLDKAGAYGIQGFGSALVRGITGDYFAVMGLPVARLVELLEQMGYVYEFGALSRRPGAS